MSACPVGATAVGNVKISLSERYLLLLHPHVGLYALYVPYTLVFTRVCMVNGVSVMAEMLHLYKFTLDKLGPQELVLYRVALKSIIIKGISPVC